jgi:hypothetical protein
MTQRIITITEPTPADVLWPIVADLALPVICFLAFSAVALWAIRANQPEQ